MCSNNGFNGMKEMCAKRLFMHILSFLFSETIEQIEKIIFGPLIIWLNVSLESYKIYFFSERHKDIEEIDSLYCL